jgi:signal transduction histidine kinase
VRPRSEVPAKRSSEQQADHVRQVLVNLSSNAVKFTPDGGRVTVSSGRTVAGMPGAWIRVCDSGPGIPVDDQERIFRPLEKADVRTPGNQEGAGLAGGDRITASP